MKKSRFTDEQIINFLKQADRRVVHSGCSEIFAPRFPLAHMRCKSLIGRTAGLFSARRTVIYRPLAPGMDRFLIPDPVPEERGLPS